MLGRWLAAGCFILAGGLILNAVLGPLVLELIDYRYTETFRNQGIGLDAFAIAVASPLLLGSGVLALRGHVAGPVLAMGPALMAAYMFPQYVLGAHYIEIEGNNERFFLMHLALFGLGVGVSILAWHAIGARLPTTSRRFQRWTGALLFAVGAFLISRYLVLYDIWRGKVTEEYAADPIAFWLIAFMDLGVVLPAAIATGLAQFMGSRAVDRGLYAIVGWFALVGPAVAAMGFAMVANDDPNASLPTAVAFAVYGGAFALLAMWLYMPLFTLRDDS